MSKTYVNSANISNTIKYLTIMTILVTGIFFASGVAAFDVFAQTNNSSGGSGSGGNLPTPIEGLQDAEFSQVVLSTSQIDELSNTVKNATQAAEDEGNMTKVLLQLKVLQNQLDVIKQEASMFGP